MNAIPSERASTFRAPSTANLYIDSLDRTTGNSTDFTISPNQNILTGFFTRLAVNEVVMDYCIPNVRAVDGNNTFTVVVGAGVSFTVTVPDGFYAVSDLLDALVVLLNAAGTGVGQTWSLTTTNGIFLTYTSNYQVTETTLSVQLNLTGISTPSTSKQIECPVILNSKYFDIVCDNLTYCQDLKDSSTSSLSRDVLYRWYLAWDNEGSYDAYGFPILQGYRTFIQRRYLSFPKQIKWDNNQPIGQLGFQVYNSSGEIVSVSGGEIEFNLSLLVSEV